MHLTSENTRTPWIVIEHRRRWSLIESGLLLEAFITRSMAFVFLPCHVHTDVCQIRRVCKQHRLSSACAVYLS